jgi:hypothetical protein
MPARVARSWMQRERNPGHIIGHGARESAEPGMRIGIDKPTAGQAPVPADVEAVKGPRLTLEP